MPIRSDDAIDNGARNLIINPSKPPFDNPELRRAVPMTLDRKAFIDILVEGQGQIGGVMQPPPDGVWGMPPDRLASLPGYGADVGKKPGRGPRDHGKARLRTR